MNVHRGEPVRDSFRTHRTATASPAAPGAGGRRPRFPVSTTRPHPDVWALALILAGGDKARRRVIDASTVLVVNK